MSSSAPRPLQPDTGIAIVRVTTREVLIDLIALSGRDQPVLDLKLADLQVSESFVSLDSPNAPHPATVSLEPETITSLRVVDPSAPQPSSDDSRSGFQIAGSCLELSTPHYQIAFHPGPDASQSGYHRVVISAKRSGIRLFYRHQYYVGLKEPLVKPPVVQSEAINKLLLQAACYHPQIPASISLRPRFIESGRTDVIRYSVAIDADSLSFVTLERNGNNAGIDRLVALDYGVCNLDNRGLPISFSQAPLEKVLTSGEYARALDRGFPHILEFPAPEHIAITRFVVRDRQTGNLGVVEAAFPGVAQGPIVHISPPATQTATDLKAIEAWRNLDSIKDANGRSLNPLNMRPEPEPIGSFGSIVPAPHSFCGDVYDLSDRPEDLPDFRESDPIVSLYTSTLDVPNQIFSNLTRIPGQPPGTIPFGIDYHGVFWVKLPGDYHFLLLSDDGATLRVDDKKLIDIDGLHPAQPASARIHLDAGRHSIDVPHFENAEGAFALELWVKPHGAHSWSVFDMNDYSPPAPNANFPDPR
ncbi:PA14 domain-containing protein [Telmatobacter sp. DSM 110680]|uniref:PA14 domain-containing protein n=1 Tax=Telmatobacter sp. DSM 110680 TaxID=3036704 RepID=A0AAU7DR81_9BACT